MKHLMNLYKVPFDMIKNKSKTIEMRLNDEKRSLINISDEIEFTNVETQSKLTCKVTNLYHYDNFYQLYQNHDKIKIGYLEFEEANPEDMLVYYSKEKIDQYGVLGIELEVLSFTYCENEMVVINNKEYKIIKLLGKGKGGHSYLSSSNNNLFVLKKIHHEPCLYYSFSNKIQSEFDAYNYLNSLGIPLPKMIDIDFENEIIIKEYIEGETILEKVLNNKMKDEYIVQMNYMCKMLYSNNTNIDYFPTNFVVQNEILYYIDYECNSYSDQWNFENWGIKYWHLSEELKTYLNENK